MDAGRSGKLLTPEDRSGERREAADHKKRRGRSCRLHPRKDSSVAAVVLRDGHGPVIQTEGEP